MVAFTSKGDFVLGEFALLQMQKLPALPHTGKGTRSPVNRNRVTGTKNSSTSVIILDSVMQIVRQLEQGLLINTYINNQTLEQH